MLAIGRPLLGLTIGLELVDGNAVWVRGNVLPIARPGDSIPSAVLISLNDIGPARAAQQRPAFPAQHDALAGLYNCVYFSWRVQAVMK